MDVAVLRAFREMMWICSSYHDNWDRMQQKYQHVLKANELACLFFFPFSFDEWINLIAHSYLIKWWHNELLHMAQFFLLCISKISGVTLMDAGGSIAREETPCFKWEYPWVNAVRVSTHPMKTRITKAKISYWSEHGLHLLNFQLMEYERQCTRIPLCWLLSFIYFHGSLKISGWSYRGQRTGILHTIGQRSSFHTHTIWESRRRYEENESVDKRERCINSNLTFTFGESKRAETPKNSSDPNLNIAYPYDSLVFEDSIGSSSQRN